MESMKKILFSFSLLLCFALAAQAQHAGCSKTCTDKGVKSSCEVKVASASTPIPSEYQTAAAKVASLDATIEPRTNPVTGEVTYVRKETSAHNGEVSFAALNFDPASSTFVNVSPTQVAAKENTQSCGASAKSTSAKSCCAGGTKASCGDKAKTSTASSTASPAPVTATKTSGGSKD